MMNRPERSSGEITYPEKVCKVSKYMDELGERHSDVMNNFHALGEAVLRPGALGTKEKELIGLGIAVSARCDDCIAFHTRSSLQAGATEQEIVETLGVAILMGGGPSVAYATHVMEALEQFRAQRNEVAPVVKAS